MGPNCPGKELTVIGVPSSSGRVPLRPSARLIAHELHDFNLSSLKKVHGSSITVMCCPRSLGIRQTHPIIQRNCFHTSRLRTRLAVSQVHRGAAVLLRCGSSVPARSWFIQRRHPKRPTHGSGRTERHDVGQLKTRRPLLLSLGASKCYAFGAKGICLTSSTVHGLSCMSAVLAERSSLSGGWKGIAHLMEHHEEG